MTDWARLDYVAVDVEGNGQQPPDLVELAVVPVVGGAVGEPASWLVRPPHPIRHLATAFHGLTTSDVAGCPPVAEIAADVTRALHAGALIAHNAHVDVGVLRRELRGWAPPETFDTLRLSRRLAPGLPDYKLGTLAGHFGLAGGLAAELKPHRAAYDALVAVRLFVVLAGMAGSLEGLRGQPLKADDDKAAGDGLF